MEPPFYWVCINFFFLRCAVIFTGDSLITNHSLWSHHFAFNVIIVFSSIANFELPECKNDSLARCSLLVQIIIVSWEKDF